MNEFFLQSLYCLLYRCFMYIIFILWQKHIHFVKILIESFRISLLLTNSFIYFFIYWLDWLGARSIYLEDSKFIYVTFHFPAWTACRLAGKISLTTFRGVCPPLKKSNRRNEKTAVIFFVLFRVFFKVCLKFLKNILKII